MKLLSSVLIGGLAVYAGLAAYLYLFQANYIYFPELPGRRVESTPADMGLAFETLKIATEDGETLEGWYVPAHEARATLLYFHGNGGNIGHRVEIIEMFHHLGLNVLIADYRGYGNSTGQPSEEGTARDAEAAWRHLVETRRLPAEEIILYGESLGGAVAARLAQRHTPRALVLYAAFTSIPDMARHYYPYLPTALLARYRYDTRAALAALRCPLLILHSREDEIVPYRHGEELLAAAPGSKRLAGLRGGHNDALFVSRDRFIRELEAFLQATAGKR